jgi:hypothetical protein
MSNDARNLTMALAFWGVAATASFALGVISAWRAWCAQPDETGD